MTFDDFFTSSEMSNGLTVPSRVSELMAIIQKEKDCTVENSADWTRQLSAVASVIAATENKDCLDLFLQLDGLHFISNWLKDAQKFSSDTTDGFAEESIILMLGALEKLHVDYEKLVASETWTTVQNLLVHNSSKVQDKARVLFESWKTKKRDLGASLSEVDKAGDNADIERDVGCSESSLGDASVLKENSVIDNDGHELTRDDPLPSAGSDAVRDQVESAHNLNEILDPPIGDEKPQDNANSPSLMKPTLEPCSPASSRQDTDTQTEFNNDLKSPSYMEQSLKIKSLSEKLGSLEESNSSESRPITSNSDAVTEMKVVTELSSQKNSNAGSKNLCDEGVSNIDSSTIESDAKSVRDDGSDANQSGSLSASAKEGCDINYRMFPKSSGSEKSWGKFLSGIVDDGKLDALDLHASDNNITNSYAFGRRQNDRKPDRADKKSNVEIDYGIVDPLEVAMQVAMEVEREVCSSSENLPEGSNTRPPNSPDSVSGKQSNASDGNSSDESSLMQEETRNSSENLDAEQTDGVQDIATSQVTEAAQEEANTGKGPCNFDLNQEICSEDFDLRENQFSTTVSVVSASRAAAPPGLVPGAPLQFEGNLGWKGSALTSAFRPASPRRIIPESDKDPSTGLSSSGSKQRLGFLDFDLNVTESVDESSVETNSKRSEHHLELDLNRMSEDGGALLDCRIGQFFPQGNWSQSSSSSKQQPIRNIDLNDGPSFINDNSYISRASQNFNVAGGIKSDDLTISLMGTRVEVNRKDLVFQTPSLHNGRTSEELAFDSNLGRTGGFVGFGSSVPYPHSSMYGYNNVAPGPAMPFVSPLYGPGQPPIPYMVDSRGAPVIPQIMPTAFSQQPFLINMNGSSHPNGVGPSRSSFDLNSGMSVESGSSKDPAGLGLFLNSAQFRPIEDPNSQLTMSSTVSGKRKEPENGYDYYPFKHYTPPWKQG